MTTVQATGVVKATIGFGVALVVLGVVAYAGSGAESVTALIPSFFGIVLVALGVAGRREGWRAVSMHMAAVVALLGLLGGAMGLPDLPDLLTGEDLERPWAVGTQSAMAVILAVYLVLSIRSFIAARRS
ncbi:MAG: hypothetical protein M3203_08300 [Actinomycetota bacterium]|nr:hypothetical protein [Actinomycetota bacterium]